MGAIALLLATAACVAAGCADSDAAAQPARGGVPAVPLPSPLTRHGRPPRRTFPRSRARVPILMYHALGRPPAGAPYPLLYTSGDAFRAQLKALHRHGFHAVPLRQVWSAWHGHSPLPTHPLVITFDDGFGSVYRIGLRAMRVYRWPGDLFLLIDHLDQPGDWGVTDRQIRRLVHAGWELDAHTYTEVDLPALSTASAWHDIHGSRMILRHRFQQPVAFFCYPVGAFDAGVIQLVRDAGYAGAVTTIDGIAAPRGDSYAMPRIRVSGDEAPSVLLQSIRSAGG